MISYDLTQIQYSAHEFRDMREPFGCHGRRADPFHIVNFYYKIDDVFNEVYKRTSLIGKHRATEQQPHTLDTTALTQDEQLIFTSLLPEVAQEVYQHIYAYCKGLNGYLYDEPALSEYEAEQTDFSASVHYVVKYPLYCHEANLQMIDNAIYNALIFGVIAKWSEYVLPQEQQFWDARYQKARMDVKVKLASVNSRLREISHPM